MLLYIAMKSTLSGRMHTGSTLKDLGGVGDPRNLETAGHSCEKGHRPKLSSCCDSTTPRVTTT
eukprot:11525042-Alexandrium_andersonii.AAC.1